MSAHAEWLKTEPLKIALKQLRLDKTEASDVIREHPTTPSIDAWKERASILDRAIAALEPILLSAA